MSYHNKTGIMQAIMFLADHIAVCSTIGNHSNSCASCFLIRSFASR